MRILIYSYNYHPEPIGIAPLMTELAEGLASQGHRVRVVTAMPNYPERRIYPEYRGRLYQRERRNGVDIQRCYVWIRPNPGLVARLLLEGSFVLLSFLQALWGWRPQVILFASPSLPVCVPVALLGQLYRCPTVLNLQDILPEAAIQTGLIKNAKAIWVFEQLERFAYWSATHISVIAEGFRQNLLAKQVPEAKISTIANWVNVDFIKPLPKYDNGFRHAHQLGNKFVVMYSGNIARTQGIHTVIRAAQLLQAVPTIQFIIVGETGQLADLAELCHELGVTNVLLLPFAPREQLPEMLAAADVSLIIQKANVVGFNMPSKTQVILASGRAIVASVPPEGTAAQAVLASGGGVVVPPEDPQALADTLLALSQDPERVAALGAQGRRYALAHYSFESALSHYQALFQSLVPGQGSRAAAPSEEISPQGATATPELTGNPQGAKDTVKAQES